MKNKYSIYAQLILSLIFSISFSLIICSNTYGQLAQKSNFFLSNNSRYSLRKDDKTLTGKSFTVPMNVSGLISEVEHQAFDILNQKRIEKGLAVLRWSESVAKIARLHSQDMAQYNYLSHSDHDGKMVNDRADLLGISNWKAIGENIASNPESKRSVEVVCNGWINSPSHRENIMNSRWSEAGIGVAIASDGSYYFTEVFIMI